jgi:hypothetical protein
MALPAEANLAAAPSGVAFGRLTARVRVHFGVQDEDVHLAGHGEDMVQPSEADVIGPAVAAY